MATIITDATEYRVMRGPPHWQRRSTNGWQMIGEPATADTLRALQSTRNMVVYVTTGGTVYLRKIPCPEYSEHNTIVVAGPMREVWDTFLSYGRMAVSS